jgi:hypothetical protein
MKLREAQAETETELTPNWKKQETERERERKSTKSNLGFNKYYLKLLSSLTFPGTLCFFFLFLTFLLGPQAPQSEDPFLIPCTSPHLVFPSPTFLVVEGERERRAKSNEQRGREGEGGREREGEGGRGREREQRGSRERER